MTKLWRTGEIAEISGLSVRTLRYYDQIKLLSPTEHTNSGHRRYTHKDLQSLLEIITLKQMGFSLEEIRDLKEQGNHSTISEILNNQIQRVKSYIDVQQKLLIQLEHVHDEFSNSKRKFISLKSITTLFELMNANQTNHFSKNQINRMREHYYSIDETTLHLSEIEFNSILEELKDKKEKGISPHDESVINIAARWNNMIQSISPKDNELRKNAELFYADNPDLATKVGLESSLYQYLYEALSNIPKDN
ncbi:MerR family transcriptional regulator [Paucisalibacillus globulus]|uniref:MerR family transcriptional regulator n=1 Tax=Paucisalibacillus globulus TaxID=351095 RepID=UPI000BB8B4B3|nr:MerR family transcriptional regulator [Paucisalibacillus globulus]